MAFSIMTIFSKLCAQTVPATESILNSKSLAIETALETNDWAVLKGILNQVRPQNIPVCDLDSPYRFLYGHVALATGENSIAVEHFYCDSDSNDSTTLNQWYTWTKALAERRSDLASSHYFYGDALARMGNLMGNLAKAKEEFDTSLGIAPDHFLALNARGVVKWLIFEADSSKEEYELEAVDDFIQATRISPDFADAWANRGLVGLRDETELSKSIEKFEKALELDPDYWLALNSKAVANGAGGRYWAYQKDISKIEANAPDTPFLGYNTGRQTVNDSTLASNRGGTLTGSELKVNFGINVGVANFGFEYGQTFDRGGIFMYLKEGENLVVDKNDKPTPIGTWFALNYPPQHVEDVVSK